MFFLAESSRTGSGELIQSPPELTCYRRNLFQITGNVTLPRTMQCASFDRGERLPIVSQELTISATESVEGSPVKIISVPWKTPTTGTAPTPEDKVEKEPTSFPLDQSGTHDMDPDYSFYPFAWKRLQFRVATANNGRRRELQQHFTIKLSVVATLTSGSKITLCEALSGPIIVRGRSPRNFSQRKDVPLSGSAASMRKSISSLTSMAPAVRRSSTTDVLHHHIPKLESSTDVVYTMSPTTTLRRTSSPGSYEWQHPHPVTAPVSPYLPPTTEHAPSGTPTLKRKSSESPREMQLAVPSNGAFGQRNSAPPPERPRKMSRPSRASAGGAAASAYIPTTQVATSLPATTFTFTPSLPAPTFFHHSLPKTAGAEPSELMHDYFHMGGSEEWHVDPLYRPHILHPTHLPTATSVGGPALGRGCYGDDLA